MFTSRKTDLTASQSQEAGMVQFEHVSKSYGPVTVLQETNLTIDAGEFFAMIGPSGSGKSTLLGILAGFTPPSTGAVRINGRDIVSMPPYRRNIGMVFQNYALFPHMTVAENLGFPLKMRGMSKSESAARIAEALAMVRLEGMAERRPSQLSGGQQQRVALARAAIYQPQILLMDEPLGALDKNLREEMQEEIKVFQQKLRATVVYVTHDQQEATFLGDRLAVMRNGIMEQIGAPRSLYEEPGTSFVASFLGEASLFPIAEIRETRGKVAAVTTTDGLSILALAPNRIGQKRFVCIRPENVVIGDNSKHLDNHFLCLVQESIFTTGSLRYKVRLPNSETLLTIRTPSHPGTPFAPPGSLIDVGWNAAMATIVVE